MFSRSQSDWSNPANSFDNLDQSDKLLGEEDALNEGVYLLAGFEVLWDGDDELSFDFFGLREFLDL